MKKKCNICKKNKNEKDYYGHEKSPDKIGYTCKVCCLMRQRKYARKKGIKEKNKRKHWRKGYRQCLKCFKQKKYEFFTTSPRGYMGLAPYCKPCTSKFVLNQRAKDPHFSKKLSVYRQKIIGKLCIANNKLLEELRKLLKIRVLLR